MEKDVVLVSTWGLLNNRNSSMIQNVVTLDDLFQQIHDIILIFEI